MRAKGVAAAQLCSTLTAGERAATLAALQANDLRLLYVTPELLATGWCAQPCMRCSLLLHSLQNTHVTASPLPICQMCNHAVAPMLSARPLATSLLRSQKPLFEIFCNPPRKCDWQLSGMV